MVRIKKELKIEEEFGEVGLRRWGNIVSDEFLKELQGKKALRIYREMAENDPTIGAIIYALKQFMGQASLIIEPADDSQEAKWIADEVAKDFRNLDPPLTPEFLFLAANFVVYGFAVFEEVFRARDGRVAIVKLSYRMPETIERWEFSEKGEVLGCYQRLLSGQEVFLPRWKILHIVTPGYSYNPMGRSLLRNAYVPYTFKKHLQILEGIGVERDLVGLPILYVPQTVFKDESKVAELKELLRQLRRDEQEGLILPRAIAGSEQLWELKLLSLSGSRQFSTSDIIARYNQEIAHTLLADLILVGLEARGSYALAREKRSLFEVGVQTCLDAIASSIRRDVLKTLMKLNGWEEEKAPILRLVLPRKPTIDELVDLISAVSKLQMPSEELGQVVSELSTLAREIVGLGGRA